MSVVPLEVNKGIGIKNLEVFVQGSKCLQVDELAIPSKGVFAILGPSGCGKSTLLRVLAGIHNNSVRYTGNLTEDGQARGVSPIFKYSMVWQTPTVFPCSVYDNLKIALRKRRVPRQEWSSEMQEALGRTGLLEELGGNWRVAAANTLSGGQRQRLCIAMGLLMKSEVVLLDEPTSALDPVATDKVEKIIADLGRERAVILVTHSIGQAKRVSGLAAMFCNKGSFGYLCENGPSGQLLCAPSSEGSRRFLQMELG